MAIKISCREETLARRMERFQAKRRAATEPHGASPDQAQDSKISG
jgi:hypothetical protein